MLFSFPYRLEATLVVVVIVGVFLYIVWRGQGKSLRIIPEGFGGFFKKLYNMLFKHIEDEEAYKENEAQRKADEEYKKELKKKKS